MPRSGLTVLVGGRSVSWKSLYPIMTHLFLRFPVKAAITTAAGASPRSVEGANVLVERDGDLGLEACTQW